MFCKFLKTYVNHNFDKIDPISQIFFNHNRCNKFLLRGLKVLTTYLSWIAIKLFQHIVL